MSVIRIIHYLYFSCVGINKQRGDGFTSNKGNVTCGICKRKLNGG